MPPATPIVRVPRIAATIAAAIGRYGRLRLRERLGRPPTPADWERAHDRTAAALHDLGIRLAGFFVKACQIAGARRRLRELGAAGVRATGPMQRAAAHGKASEPVPARGASDGRGGSELRRVHAELVELRALLSADL